MKFLPTENIKDNLATIKQVIKEQAKKWQRNEPVLVAVSKKQPIEKILVALEAGHLIFAENQVQEAISKWPNLKQEYPKAKLHFIGHLQSNKIKTSLKFFDVIESIDSEKLAKNIARVFFAEKNILTKEFLIQINIGEEKQKYGILPAEADDFIDFAKNQLKLPIKGLMCIPPLNESASLYFAFLKKIAQRNNLNSLSMGMSSDYQEAITIGTNYVRVGTAIFGRR